jgi:hypothetical protein
MNPSPKTAAFEIRASRPESKPPAPKGVPGKMIDESIPELQEWMAEGRALVLAASGHQWAIADWLLRGENDIGQRAAYDYAEKATGYSRKTLIEWAYVARNLSIRMDDLSFGHHQAVATLVPDAQKRALESAVAQNLSVVELREMARWEPHRLELDPEHANEYASVLLQCQRKEIDCIDIAARQLGHISDEGSSAIGRFLHDVLVYYFRAHPELLQEAEAKRQAGITE